MNVLDVLAQVCHRLLRLLPEVAVRMMDVPQSGDLAVADRIQKFLQAGRVGIHTVGLHKHGYIVLLRNRNQLFKRCDDGLIVHLALRCRMLVGKHTDVRGSQ